MEKEIALGCALLLIVAGIFLAIKYFQTMSEYIDSLDETWEGED